jgi:hypothetical protein
MPEAVAAYAPLAAIEVNPINNDAKARSNLFFMMFSLQAVEKRIVVLRHIQSHSATEKPE